MFIRRILKFAHDSVIWLYENSNLALSTFKSVVLRPTPMVTSFLPAVESTQEVFTTAILPFVQERLIPLVPTQFGITVIFRVGFRIYKTVACIYFLGVTISIGYQSYIIAPQISEGFRSYFSEGASLEEVYEIIFPRPQIEPIDLEIPPHHYLEVTGGEETTAVESGVEYAITKVADIVGKNPLNIDPQNQARAISIYSYTNEAYKLFDGPLLRSKGHDQILGLISKTYDDFSLLEIKPKVVVDLYGDRILDIRTCSPDTLNYLALQISSDNSCLSKAISQVYPHTVTPALSGECYKVTGNHLCTLSKEYLEQYITQGAIILPTPVVDKVTPPTPNIISNIINRMMPEVPKSEGRFTDSLMYTFRNLDAM